MRMREESLGWIESEDPEYEYNATWEKAGKRVLLLEKAYRYQRAVYFLTKAAWVCEPHLNGHGLYVMDKIICKIRKYFKKAESMYKQASKM